MSDFIYEEEQKEGWTSRAFYQVDSKGKKVKGDKEDWCIVVGQTTCGKYTEFQVSDGISGERDTSSDFLFLDEAMEECKRFNKSGGFKKEYYEEANSYRGKVV